MPGNPDEYIVWDSCVAIDAIQKTPHRWPQIEPFIRDAEKERLSIVLSEISIVEIRHLPALKAKGVSIEKQAQMIRNWLNNPYIVRRTVHPGISDLAREIASKYSVKGGADATIIATALFEEIRMIHTYDAKMQKLDGKIGSPAIRIMAPDPAQGTMWAKNT